MTVKNTIVGILTLLFCFNFVASVSAQTVPPKNDLIPTVEYPDQVSGPNSTKLILVDRLPSSDWRVILADVIKIILSITGSLSLIAFTVGGVMMVTAQGNEETITKGKGVLYWSVLALVIIAASYAVVVGITELQFFQ